MQGVCKMKTKQRLYSQNLKVVPDTSILSYRTLKWSSHEKKQITNYFRLEFPFKLPPKENAALFDNVPSGMCGQRRPRSACASAQSDQGLPWPLTESLDIIECINVEQRRGWSFRMHRMFWIDAFSLHEAQFFSTFTLKGRLQGQQPTSPILWYVHSRDCNICTDSWQNDEQCIIQHQITKGTKHVYFSTAFYHKCIHILVILDTSNNCA